MERLPQAPPRVHAEPVGENPARLLVGLQRLTLPSALVERRHAQPDELLALGVPGRYPREQVQHLPRPPPCYFGPAPLLGRAQKLLPDLGDVLFVQRVGGDVEQHRPPPQVNGLSQRVAPAREIALVLGLPRGQHQLTEAQQVELVGGEFDAIAGRRTGDQGAVVDLRQCRSQPCHLDLQGADAGALRSRAPHALDDLLHRDGAIGAQQEGGQQDSALSTPEAERGVRDLSGERS
ncbi:hypothetical protein NORO109296_25365 [Nocardiopsis rhodophaea]